MFHTVAGHGSSHSNHSISAWASSRAEWSDVRPHLTQNHSSSSAFHRISRCFIIQSYNRKLAGCQPGRLPILTGEASPSESAGSSTGNPPKCPLSNRRKLAHFLNICANLIPDIRGRKMTQADTQRIMELCRLICQEHDPAKFQKLVTDLNQVLAKKEQTLAKGPSPG
jgi:hypothetical protein